MSINGFPIQFLLSKSKEEWAEVISRLLSLLLHTITRTFELFKTFSYLFHNYDVTSLENIHSITF